MLFGIFGLKGILGPTEAMRQTVLDISLIGLYIVLAFAAFLFFGQQGAGARQRGFDGMIRLIWIAVSVCLLLGIPAHAAQVLCDPYISVSSYVTYGTRALNEGDTTLAVYSFSCALQRDEGNIAARKGLALAYLKRGEVEAALEQLRQIEA